MNESERNLESLLRVIVSGIGRKTDSPEITYDSDKAQFTVYVNPHDKGRFIGKKGITFWGIVTLFWHAGINEINRTVGFEMPDRGDELLDRRGVPFKADPNWDRNRVAAMLQQVCDLCFDGAKFKLEEDGATGATALITVSKSKRARFGDPDLSEATRVVLKAAGMAHGAVIETRVIWE